MATKLSIDDLVSRCLRNGTFIKENSEGKQYCSILYYDGYHRTPECPCAIIPPIYTPEGLKRYRCKLQTKKV